MENLYADWWGPTVPTPRRPQGAGLGRGVPSAGTTGPNRSSPRPVTRGCDRWQGIIAAVSVAIRSAAAPRNPHPPALGGLDELVQLGVEALGAGEGVPG